MISLESSQKKLISYQAKWRFRSFLGILELQNLVMSIE